MTSKADVDTALALGWKLMDAPVDPQGNPKVWVSKEGKMKADETNLSECLTYMRQMGAIPLKNEELLYLSHLYNRAVEGFKKDGKVLLNLEDLKHVFTFAKKGLTADWIPVAQLEPADKQKVFMAGSEVAGWGYYDKETKNFVDYEAGDIDNGAITHWMPSPPLPKEV